MPLTVDQAAQKIHDLVNDDGILGTGRNGHLHEINDVLHQFSAADVDRIVGKLSDADLRGWAEDATSGGIFGAQGLSSGEKRDLFNDMARELDGTQLARLSSAFSGREETLQLGEAVASFAAPAAKLDYVKALAGRSTDRDSDLQTGIGYSTLVDSDKDALAVNRVLQSLSGNAKAFDDAVGSLSDDQLAAVVKAGEGERITTVTSFGGDGSGSGSVSTTFDPANVKGLLDVAATTADANTKARLFEAAAGALKHIRDSDTLLTPNPGAGAAAAQVTAGMTAIMDSDTRGVVNRLNTDQATGTALTAYLKEVIAQDPNAHNATLGRQLAQLQGSGITNDAAAFIDKPDTPGGSFYRNAENLGYYAGAMEAAINKMNADDKTKAEIIGNAFSTLLVASTTALTKLPVSGRIVSGLANGLSRELIREVTGDLAAGRKSLRDALYELSLPRSNPNTDRYRGAADPFFQSSANTVVLNNQ